MTIHKLKSIKILGISTAEYVGTAGTIFYDDEEGSLKLSDGQTLGGVSISSGSGNGGSSSVTTSATAPSSPTAGDLWYDTVSGRIYVYYSSTWVDASPVDGAGISSTNELVNGAYTVSLSSDGTLNLPESADPGVAIIQSTESIKIISNGKTWSFANDGNLTLPPSGDILNSAGSSVLGGGASLGKFIVNGGNILATVDDQVPGAFGGYNINIDPGGESSAGISIPSVGNQQSGGTLQIFNTDSSGGQIMMNTHGGMTISSVRGTLGFGLDLETPGIPDHFHVAFETSNTFIPTKDLFFGDDYNYLKLVNSAQGVFIGTNNRTGGDQHQWRFQTDGKLKLPNNGTIVNVDGYNILDGYLTNETYRGTIDKTFNIISTYPIVSVDTGTNSFVVTGNAVGDTFTYQINVDTQSMDWTLIKVQPSTHLDGETTIYLDDQEDIVDPDWVGHDLRCVTRNYQPNYISFDTSFSVDEDNTISLNSINSIVSPNTNYNLTANNYGVETNSPVKWMEGASERVILNYVPADDRFVISTSRVSNSKYWYLGDDGTTTLPSGAGFGLGESGQLKVNDATTLSLDIRDNYGRGFYTNSEGFSLRSDGDSTWLFKTNGNLQLPAGGDIVDSTGTSVLGGGSSGVVIPSSTISTFTLGSDFTGTIVGGDGNGAGYIRVESNSGAPFFNQVPISTRLYNMLLTWSSGTQISVHAVVSGTTYNTVIALDYIFGSSSGVVSTERNDLYFTRVSGDELPFSYSADELTLTYTSGEFSFTNTNVTFPNGTVQSTAWTGSVTGITTSSSTTYAVANSDWSWGDWSGSPSREFNGSSNSAIFFAALKTIQSGDTVVIGGAFGTHTYTIDSVSTDPYNTGTNPVTGYFRISITADQAVGSVNTFTFNIPKIELAGNTTIEHDLIINDSIRLKAGADIKNSAGVSVLVSREPSFEIKTAGFTAVAGHRYGINTTDGAITAYLPVSPATGDAIFFVDSHGTFTTNNFTINGNEGAPFAKTIMGQATQVITVDNDNIGIFYNGTEWRFYA